MNYIQAGIIALLILNAIVWGASWWLSAHNRRFEHWVQQDEEMLSKWWSAYEAGDFDECRRLNYVMGKNREAHRA